MKQFLANIFDFLNNHTDYAVLRNFEGLPEHNDSRDIDIAIRRKDFRRIRKPLTELIDGLGWKIVTYLNSDRLITFVCGHISEEGGVELVQLDFFMHTSVFGLILIDNDDILAHKQYNGKIWHADKRYQFLDKYVYDRAVGAEYPEKYKSTREAVENDEIVARNIREIFGCKSLTECDKKGKKQLLIQLLKANLKKRGLSTFGNVIKFGYTQLRNRLRGNTGFSIGFTGPDGAGKTTVIDTLIEKFGPVFAKAHSYLHFRPQLFGNLGDVAHSAGLKKEVDHNYDRPHRGGKTSAASSLARLMYYSVDYILGFRLKVKNDTRITRFVIFDRYFTDIICDSRRTRIYLPYKWLYRYGKVCIPQLDYNILLTASTDTILGRKRELDREGIESINNKIDFLSDKKGYYKVLNEGTPQEAATRILYLIFENQHRKNLRRL